MNEPIVFLRRSEVMRRLGLKHTALDEMVQLGRFPRGVEISVNGRVKMWPEAEVIAFQEKLIAARDGDAAARAEIAARDEKARAIIAKRPPKKPKVKKAKRRA